MNTTAVAVEAATPSYSAAATIAVAASVMCATLFRLMTASSHVKFT